MRGPHAIGGIHSERIGSLFATVCFLWMVVCVLCLYVGVAWNGEGRV